MQVDDKVRHEHNIAKPQLSYLLQCTQHNTPVAFHCYKKIIRLTFRQLRDKSAFAAAYLKVYTLAVTRALRPIAANLLRLIYQYVLKSRVFFFQILDLPLPHLCSFYL